MRTTGLRRLFASLLVPVLFTSDSVPVASLWCPHALHSMGTWQWHLGPVALWTSLLPRAPADLPCEGLAVFGSPRHCLDRPRPTWLGRVGHGWWGLPPPWTPAPHCAAWACCACCLWVWVSLTSCSDCFMWDSRKFWGRCCFPRIIFVLMLSLSHLELVAALKRSSFSFCLLFQSVYEEQFPPSKAPVLCVVLSFDKCTGM